MADSPDRTGRRRWAIAMMSLVAITPFVSNVAPAGAVVSTNRTTSAWTVQRTQDPLTVKQGSLDAVACPASNLCVALMGSTEETWGLTTPVALWNGSSWTVEPTARPAGAIGVTLEGVTCTSATSCIAVGRYTGHNGRQLTVVETWGGSAWVVQKSPNPAGATGSVLSAVGCSSPTACSAVGSYTDTSGTEVTLAERWNGTSWAIETTPNPTGTTAIALTGVSCPSSSACVAVGDYSTGSNPLGGQYESPFAEGWNGTTWTLESIATRAYAYYNIMTGVACTAPNACIAVGYWQVSSGDPYSSVLGYAWNGATWSWTKPKNPSNNAQMAGISCPSANFCMAFGTQTAFNSRQQFEAAEIWNGSSWALVRSAARSKAPTINAIGCSSATACIAVGYDVKGGFAQSLVEAWNGTTWSLAKPPPDVRTATGLALLGVACPSSTECLGVGYNSNTTPGTVTEIWNGTSWTLQHPAALPPANEGGPSSGGYLDSISCVSTTWCEAVGSMSTASAGGETLAEHWDGTAWTAQPTPDLGANVNANLDSVSCTSATVCVAVGNMVPYGYVFETWNGTSWTSANVQLNISYNNGLTSVSCTSATSCEALGNFIADVNGNPAQAIYAVSWNGSSASEQFPSVLGYWDGVSCSSASACIAVGANGLVGSYNGSGWTVTTAPGPTGATGFGLSGVSCTSVTACTAVGGFVNGSGISQTLAETWNGTAWSVDPTPNPIGADSSGLGGVTCASATSCHSVGSAAIAGGPGLTLAEARQ